MEMLTRDNIFVAFTSGRRLELQRIKARVGFGDAKANPPLPANDVGNCRFKLFLVAEPCQGLSGVHVCMNGLSACHAGARL